MYQPKKVSNIINKSLIHALGKDETRPQLMGFYHCENLRALITCDGTKMAIIKSRYAEELSGQVINPKTFEKIYRDYPKAATVVPQIKNMKVGKIKIEKHHYVSQGRGRPTFIYLNKYDDRFELSFEKMQNSIICFNADHLKPLANGEVYNFAYSNDLQPVLFSLRVGLANDYEFDDSLLIMPSKFEAKYDRNTL